MFASLSSKLTGAFDKLRRKGLLTEADIDAAMREVRIALLEADVALPVVKSFVASLKEKALGAEVVKSVSPAQMVIKLTQDHLAELLGAEHNALNLNVPPPAVILMCGLQGSGKTTTTAKLAKRLKERQHKKTLVASLDVYRPAAQLQLEQAAQAAGVPSLPVVPGEQPLAIAQRALKEARLSGHDVLILDTAGRLHIDEALMEELRQIKALAQPAESLLVADALTGQDAVNIAQAFTQQIGITGIVLTRLDGDARGGAALSMRQITGQPIKFAGVGEKLDALEEFHPQRIAGRILDMGDVVSLVEKASQMVSQDEAEAMAARMQKGQFDLDDLLDHLRKIRKMGGVSGMLSLLPGIGKMQAQLKDAKIDESMISRQEAIILSMTPRERKFPKLLNASRRIRIAKGAGVTVPEVNRLMKQFQQMEDMMKKMRKLGGAKGLMRGGLKNMLPMG